MATETLAQALEREHHEIDTGIEVFMSELSELGALRQALNALRRHIYLEEEFVFPILRKSNLVASIIVMLREHGEIWQTIELVENAYREDLEPSKFRRSAYLLEQLLEQLSTHNKKEEPLIYPYVDEKLGPEETARLLEFIASGKLPDGWVCKGFKSK